MMAKNNNLKIRSDLMDISNTIEHLYILGNYFDEKRRKFGQLWHSNDGDFISDIYLTRDANFINTAETLYQKGKDSALALAMELPLINEIEVYPKISDYIDKIEAYRKNWKKGDKELIKKCEKIISQRTYKLNYWNIEKMLEMHKDMLMILENMEDDLNAIRNSKRYKIENIKNSEKTLKNKKNFEMDKIKENNMGPKIFLSYSHKDREIADKVDDFFISKKLSLTRDEKDASPYSDLKKFMDTIRDHDYVIMLISDAYLKSTNCMYEVVQFIQEKNYSDRIFPIIIDNEVNIFDQSEHSKYINYWQVKHKELGDKIKTLKNNGIISLQEELDKINIIQSNIGKFLKNIVELKCIPLDELESTDYKAILDKISKTFDVPQKKEVEIKSDKLKLRADDKRATDSATKTITLTEPVPLCTPLTKDGITVTVQRIERVEQPIWGQPFEVNIYFGVINNSKQVLLATGSLFYALDEKIYEDEFNAGGYGHIGDAISWIYPGQSRSVGYTKFFHSSVTIKQITWTGTFADDQTEIKLGQWKN